jgi:hypothetical protein
VKKQPGAITVVGFDASPDELTAIANGEQAASVAQFPAKMGAPSAACGAERTARPPQFSTVDTRTPSSNERTTADASTSARRPAVTGMGGSRPSRNAASTSSTCRSNVA